MKPMILIAIVALLVYVYTYWLPMKACDKKRKKVTVKQEPTMKVTEPKIEEPDYNYESEVNIMKGESKMENEFEMIEQESKNDSEIIHIQEQINEMEENLKPVSEVEIDSVQKEQHSTEQSTDHNSSYILQSGFHHEDFAKHVYNGMSNIEQNEMFARKSIGNLKSRSFTKDFNQKYLHNLSTKK